LHIRCERCATLYELDEALLAPEGTSVQCSRCEHVFTARPVAASAPPAPVPDANPVPVPSATATPAPRVTPVPVPGATATPPPASAPQGQRTAASESPRAARSAQPAVYRPVTTAPTVRANPVLRQDAVGAFEARLRRAARVRLIVPIAAVLLLVGVGAGVLLVRGRIHIHSSAAGVRTGALTLVALDDAESLDRAAAMLDDALRRTPKDRVLGADRALALVLRASALADERDAIIARIGAQQDERERLQREHAEGLEQATARIDGAVQALEREARANDERAQALARGAQEALEKVERELGDDVSVQRARAIQDALAGDHEKALRKVAQDRARGSDAWLDLAESVAVARGADPAAAERALAKVSVAHPELIRARYLLARAQVALGRRGEARTTLDALLVASPKHEGARRLRDALSATPAAAAAPDGAPPRDGPDGNGAPPPRKSAAQRAAPAGSRPPDGGPVERVDSKLPAGADVSSPDAPSPVASPAPHRARAADALAPAALPDPAPASGAPQVAPLSLDSAPPHPRAVPAETEDAPGGGG
jgi:predicted Zn finger-like uncharacterized protein